MSAHKIPSHADVSQDIHFIKKAFIGACFGVYRKLAIFTRPRQECSKRPLVCIIPALHICGARQVVHIGVDVVAYSYGKVLLVPRYKE